MVYLVKTVIPFKNYAIFCELCDRMQYHIVHAQFKVSYHNSGPGKHQLLKPLNLINSILISYEPFCNQAVKLKRRFPWALKIKKIVIVIVNCK